MATRTRQTRRSSTANHLLSSLQKTHPIWERCQESWLRNEARLRGGDAVLHELRNFDWETLPAGYTQYQRYTPWQQFAMTKYTPAVVDRRDVFEPSTPTEDNAGDHYLFRSQTAVYVPFPKMFTELIVGFIMDNHPEPGSNAVSLGALGDLRGPNEASPTLAESFWYDVDGLKSDWPTFWAAALEKAMATGHRWIFVNAPREPATTEAEAITTGRRPVLEEWSPVEVINWEYRDSILQWLVKRGQRRVLTFDERKDELTDEWRDTYLLMVRAGCADWGTVRAAGGWWLYDEGGVELDTGTWERTEGNLPIELLVYDPDHQDLSRPATTELGQVASGYMNLSSAADFDAWDAGMGVQFLAGVDSDGHNLAIRKLKLGNKVVPLRVNKETGQVPNVIDSASGAVGSQVYEKRLKQKMAEAKLISSYESETNETRTGMAQRAEFGKKKVPKLVLVAQRLASAQNKILPWVGRRFGKEGPFGFIKWTKDFDLVKLAEDINELFALESLAGISSPTFRSKAMRIAISEKNVITNKEELGTIEREYKQSAVQAQQQLQQANQQQQRGQINQNNRNGRRQRARNQQGGGNTRGVTIPRRDSPNRLSQGS